MLLADRWPDSDTLSDSVFMVALVFGGAVLGFVLAMGMGA